MKLAKEITRISGVKLQWFYFLVCWLVRCVLPFRRSNALQTVRWTK